MEEDKRGSRYLHPHEDSGRGQVRGNFNDALLLIKNPQCATRTSIFHTTVDYSPSNSFTAKQRKNSIGVCARERVSTYVHVYLITYALKRLALREQEQVPRSQRTRSEVGSPQR